MKELKKGFTQIVEPARLELQITRDEYALCSYIHYRIADPRQKRAGWCCDSKQEVAEFIGVSRPGLYKMAMRLNSESGLLELNQETGDWRVTVKWIDTENRCKLSLQNSINSDQKSVNKVDKDCKQSLQKKSKSVNKVDTRTYIIEKDIKREGEEGQKISSSPETENQTLEAEEKRNDLHRGAAGEPCPNCSGAGWYVGRNGRETCERCLGVGLNFPLHPPFAPTGEHIAPQPAKKVRMYDPELPGVTIVDSVPGTYTPNPPTEFKRVNIGEEIERIRTDYLLKENFTRTRRIPETLFDEYVNAFELEAGSTGETYANVPALRKHFLNWSGSRYEISQKKTTKFTGNNRSHITNAGGDLSKYLEKQKF